MSEGIHREAEKRAQRSELLRRMKEREGDSDAVSDKIRDYFSDRPDYRVVASYAALAGEVDLSNLVRTEDRIWVFPKVEGDDLRFYAVDNYDEDLVEGAFGIREPKHGLREILPKEVDLFLCPGLGFDAAGGRMGRGRGFYDRLLAQARKDCIKLGVCFTHQMIEKVAMDDHDIRMDEVIHA